MSRHRDARGRFVSRPLLQVGVTRIGVNAHLHMVPVPVPRKRWRALCVLATWLGRWFGTNTLAGRWPQGRGSIPRWG